MNFLRLLRWRTKLPTLLHFTHSEAGAPWVASVLRHIFAEQTASVDQTDTVNAVEVYRSLALKPGYAYLGLMVTGGEFLARADFRDARRFAVIRDLRDTLVAHYNSLIKGEESGDAEVRGKLQAMDVEGGLLYLIDQELDRLVALQRSWLTSGEVLMRYEDFVREGAAEFERLLIDRLELAIPREEVRAAVDCAKLESTPVGEWKKHFTQRVAEALLTKCGDLLVSAGYERDSSWAEKLGATPPPPRAYSTALLVRSREEKATDFTLIHLTHAKAGSSWICRILQELFPKQIAPRGRMVAKGGDLSQHVFESGRVYPAMFMRADQFDAHRELSNALRFVVIRDLRDTLVSLYFSIKVSHPLDAEGKRQKERETLKSLNAEEGLLHMMETQLPGAAELQRSWLGRDELLYRYEDLLPRDYILFRELLIERFRLPITEKALRAALRKYSFESHYGRKLGQEDETSHGRQGAPGNWRKHFTPRVTEVFAARFGQVLIDTGYEPDLEWVNLSR